MDPLYIDPEAKTRILLNKLSDKTGQPYYIGKFQFPGTLKFDTGVCFMVFVSEDGNEELQIAPLDPNKSCKNSRSGAGLNNGRFSIDLYPMVDAYGKKYYIGEALGIVNIELRQGIFFTIFTSYEGREEIQISELKQRRRQEYDIPREPREFTKSPYSSAAE